MPGSGSGPLGLLLMIAPLAAIPVFAIVGVPQFAPVSASQGEDDAIDWNESPVRQTAVASESDSPGRSADDLFAPVANLPTHPQVAEPKSGKGSSPISIANQSSGQSGNSRAWLPPPEALDQWEVRPNSSPASETLKSRQKAADSKVPRADRTRASEADTDGLVSTDGFDPDLLEPDRVVKPARNVHPAEDGPVASGSPKRSPAAPSRGIELPPDLNDDAATVGQSLAEQAGWQAAAERLEELGIRKYRLESQIEDQTFVFVCNFSSPENPRIVRRFEAEADTPLEAVQEVLQQIEGWRSRNARGDDAEPSADDEQ